MSNPDDPFQKALRYTRELVRRDVAAGFYSADEILANAVEAAGDGLDAPESIRPAVHQDLIQAWTEHRRAQSTWPDRTDCERLDAAFADLETLGIVCRQNFSCCGNCGCAEIGAEIADAEADGRTIRGYAFYHMQDTEGAVEGGHLYLNYGATEDGEDAALAVARDLVEVIEQHGLATDWNGSWRQRIGVTLDWKRRRPAEAGRGPGAAGPGLFDDCE